MRFHSAYVRGTCARQVSDADLTVLAAALAAEPAEIVLNAHGACVGGQRIETAAIICAALARRNIRSLLARDTDEHAIIEGLQLALTASSEEAEDALEDAGLAFNLRYSLFTTPDAELRIVGSSLNITNGQPVSVALPRAQLREVGGAWFSLDALARLVSLDVDNVAFSPSAIQMLAMQFDPGGLMMPDAAHRHLHKGDWRSVRRAVFVKEFCTSCGRCFVYCPDNAIIHAMFDKHDRHTTGVLGIDVERCTACGICAEVCPPNRDGYKAIVMAGVDAEVGREAHRVS